MPRRVTTEQAVEAVRRLGSQRKAAKELGVSNSYVGRLVRQHERESGERIDRNRGGYVPGAGRPRKLTPTEARRLVAEHGSQAAAARAAGVSWDTLAAATRRDE